MTDLAALDSVPQYGASSQQTQYQADVNTGNILDNAIQSHLTQPVFYPSEDNGESLPATSEQEEPSAQDEEPVIDIAVNNVVCVFNTRCHLNLKKIAMEALHVEFRRDNGMCLMKIRHPKTTASIWSSGKITCTGSTSEEEAKIAARKFARTLQKLGFRVRFTDFRVVNVLATCTMPFAININEFSRENYRSASYEPELHPAVTYRIKSPKATLKIFSTGSITVTAPRVCNIQSAIEHIFPLVYQFKKDKKLVKSDEIQAITRIKRPNTSKSKPVKRTKTINDDTDSEVETTDGDSDQSDQSLD